MPKILHESVVGVLSQIGVKPAGKSLTPANNRAYLRESQETLETADSGAVVRMHGHPHLSKTSWTVAEGVEAAIKMAQAACAKAGGFAIIEAKGNDVACSFTKDKAKAKVTKTKVQEAKTEDEEDETDGTGEASGDTGTNTKGKNDKGVGTKKGTKADNKGEENSEEVHEAEDGEMKPGEKPTFLKPGGKEKLQAMMARKKALAAKGAQKTPAEVKEEAELDAALDQIAEQFYESLEHPVTFVLYPEGKAEIHGIKEDELAPFGGTAPAVPKKYSKKAKDAGPNSKVDMGVLSIYKTEGMDAQSAKILTGKDFKACGWGTPGKGTGKVAGWQDTGKEPLNAKKDLKAGTES